MALGLITLGHISQFLNKALPTELPDISEPHGGLGHHCRSDVGTGVGERCRRGVPRVVVPGGTRVVLYW